MERLPVIGKAVGIDLSLTATGLCLKNGTNLRARTVKTKPQAFKNILERMRFISDRVIEFIPEDVSLVVIEDYFTPHCCRHWFTTHLRNGGEGMPREYIQELRGDAHKDAMDIYNHVDHEKLRKSYMSFIPQLGII